MADGELAGEASEDVGGEDVGDEAHGLVAMELDAVGGNDAGGFLSAMLKGVEREIGELGGLGMVVDGDDAALFVQLVENIFRLFDHLVPRGLKPLCSLPAKSKPQVKSGLS